MKKYCFIPAFLILTTAQLFSQQAGPSAAEVKLREMLKAVTTRATTAEAESASLKAEKVTSDAKLKELEEKVSSMGKRIESLDTELKENKEASARREGELSKELADKSADLERHKKSLDKWQASHAEVTQAARKKESERTNAVAKGSALERRIADLRSRNTQLYQLGLEILEKYRSFGLGLALGAREPFVGNTRTKLETIVQEYGDALLDHTADAKAKPAPSAPPSDAVAAPKDEKPKP